MNLFTYGTLMDPAVWARVAQEECPTERVVLHGYEARRLHGVTFPGLIEAPGCATPGLLYRGVSTAALARLDAYEDDFYVRVPLILLAESGPETAEVYLILPEHRSLVRDESWQPPG